MNEAPAWSLRWEGGVKGIKDPGQTLSHTHTHTRGCPQCRDRRLVCERVEEDARRQTQTALSAVFLFRWVTPSGPALMNNAGALPSCGCTFLRWTGAHL